MSLPPIYTICKHRNRLFPLMKVFWKDWCPVKLCDPRTVGTGTHFVKKAKPEKTTLFLSLIRKLCFCEHWQTCFLSVMITFEQILIKLCEGVDTCGVYCQHIKSTVRSFKMSCHIWPLTFPSRPIDHLKIKVISVYREWYMLILNMTIFYHDIYVHAVMSFKPLNTWTMLLNKV